MPIETQIEDMSIEKQIEYLMEKINSKQKEIQDNYGQNNSKINNENEDLVELHQLFVQLVEIGKESYRSPDISTRDKEHYNLLIRQFIKHIYKDNIKENPIFSKVLEIFEPIDTSITSDTNPEGIYNLNIRRLRDRRDRLPPYQDEIIQLTNRVDDRER
jgi:hypothetical protein